ncbi:MAG: hypothetical protein LBH96_02940 [Candidatus Peribacteria bacterium]|jgi:hypothetical protein|nr:hypothetical protein [Candidatus Peribacteria bacterium]
MLRYTPKDVQHVSYSEFDTLIGKLEIQVRNFLERNHMGIDIIVPLFQHAKLPAERLASSMGIRTVIPYHIAHNHTSDGCLHHMLLNRERYVEMEYRQEIFSPKGILILDTHTISANIPKKFVQELQTFYSGISMLFLTLVFSDIACKDFPCPLIYCQKSRECLQERGVLDKVFVFPRENENFVLQDVNAMLIEENH